MISNEAILQAEQWTTRDFGQKSRRRFPGIGFGAFQTIW